MYLLAFKEYPNLIFVRKWIPVKTDTAHDILIKNFLAFRACLVDIRGWVPRSKFDIFKRNLVLDLRAILDLLATFEIKA